MKKKTMKAIRAVAAKIPQTFFDMPPGVLYHANPRAIRDGKGRAIPGAFVRDGYESRPVNHIRRVKKAFKRGGWLEVKQYCKPFLEPGQATA